MASKHLMMALLGTALLSVPALAQTQSPSSPASPSAASSSTMSTGNWMTQERPGQWRASKIEGLNVYNEGNEKIGDIRELLVDQSGRIEAVVVGVGGFLGMGEHDVAVPFDQIKFVNEPRAAATAANTAPPGAAGTTTGATTSAPTTTGSTATTAPAAPADTMNRAAPDHALLNMTKDQLKAAPEFKYSR
ncbi:PRC-barrel domain-containing protein [Microvirga sp. VF16]|uniref:PRC-barrel domain-containing protein n=1 Tax=Microvirga sp. VF16 TaxID=2807101 RepID=UPI00193CAA00|nr:PRC-barrel domain-containing protein [Microvirga sp. VF16]QRM29506.1 PRC-barrel domain-containing protein [Microvirga sp. VF16]